MNLLREAGEQLEQVENNTGLIANDLYFIVPFVLFRILCTPNIFSLKIRTKSILAKS